MSRKPLFWNDKVIKKDGKVSTLGVNEETLEKIKVTTQFQCLFVYENLRDVETAKQFFLTMPVGVSLLLSPLGNEGLFIIAKTSAILGSITFWSYDSAAIGRLRCVNGGWQSDEWEYVS